MNFFIKVLIFEYFNLFIMIMVSSILAIVLILISFILVLESPDSEKLSTYECGYEPYDSSRHIFNIRFFLIAILFVIFDIEILFLIPWSISISKLNLLSFWSVLDFIFELGIGFFYVWYTNSLDWK
jgi:NADH-quinone oxidoreductase subunit A